MCVKSKTLITMLLLIAISHSALADQALENGLSTIQDDDIAEHVAILASDEFEGRMTGTAGEVKTVEHIADQFKKLDIQPAVNGSYFQGVPLLGIRSTEPPTLQLEGHGETISWPYGQHQVAGTQLPQDQVSLKSSEVIFAGYGIAAPDYDWDDFKNVDVKGKTVLFLWGDPGQAEGNPDLFKGMAMTRHGMRHDKTEYIKSLGAAAVFWIHDEPAIGYPWSVYGNASPNWSYQLGSSKQRLQVSGVMQIEGVAKLFEAAGLDFDATRKAAAQPGFRALSLGFEASMDIKPEYRYLESQNVLGMIPGRERPNEVVVYSAHWDHDGMDKNREGDQIFNGAVDNATGTAVLIELAEAYSQLEQAPERTILFFATAAEERGLLGSRYYVEYPLYPMEETMAVINMDALFPFGETKGMTVTALGSSEVEEYMAIAAQRVGRELQDDGMPQIGAYYRSDHYPFAAKGVPGTFAVGGPGENDDVDIQNWIDYGSKKYHQPADEYDAEEWDMGGIVQDAKIFFETGFRIANDTRVPNWYLNNEFRSLRDKARSEYMKKKLSKAGGNTGVGATATQLSR